MKMFVNSSVTTSVTSLVKTFTEARASVKISVEISVNNLLVTSVETLVLMDLPVPSSLGPHGYF